MRRSKSLPVNLDKLAIERDEKTNSILLGAVNAPDSNQTGIAGSITPDETQGDAGSSNNQGHPHSSIPEELEDNDPKKRNDQNDSPKTDGESNAGNTSKQVREGASDTPPVSLIDSASTSDTNNPDVSEILLNRPGEVYVEKSEQMTRYPISEWDELTLSNLFQLIANENKQRLHPQQPLLAAHLNDGSRIQLVIPPVTRYPVFALRRQVKQAMRLCDYQNTSFYKAVQTSHLHDNADGILHCAEEKKLLQYYQTKNWDDFIRLAIRLKKNIVISGGTSSGKTTFLNACLAEIPLGERLVILEDTREIETFQPNQVQLLSLMNQAGIANMTMKHLLHCSLRLRPDRIIIGEIRGQEILEFVSSCASGHAGNITTIHASSPQLAFLRMVQLYQLNNVPAMSEQDIADVLHAVIDVVIQLGKTQHGRQVLAIYYRDAK